MDNIMLKKIILTVLVSLLFFFSNTTVQAANKVIDGVYIPHRGWGESLELFPGEVNGEQLGKFRVVFKRQNWNELTYEEKQGIRRKFVIKGVFHGVVENIATAPVPSHQFSNNQRNGAFFSSNDILTITDAQPCSNAGGVILDVIETINIDYGTGIYADLQSNSSFTVSGTINTCNSQNDFEIIEGLGSMCFGNSCN